MRLAFPILEFDEHGRMLPLSNEKDLTTSAYDFWKKGGYRGLVIVDSNGVERVIKETKKIGYPGLFFGYSLMRHRGVRVELIFERESRTIPLEELKAKVLECIRKEYWFWRATDVKALLGAIRDATSHREIIDLLLGKR